MCCAVQTPSNKAIEVTTVASSFHIEINPGDAGIYDRHVVQEIIKEIAQNTPLNRGFKGALQCMCVCVCVCECVCVCVCVCVCD
jgi:hypothetical protein